MARWSSLVAIALVGVPSAAGAQSRLVVTAPDSVTGDGVTAVEVTVRVEPATAAGQLADLELRASAGTVGDVAPAGDHAVSYRFVPPRVAADTPVVLTAAARHADKRLAATATLDALAPTAKVQTRSTGGVFDLRVPDRVRLGQDTGVELSVARDSGAPPQILVSVGAVSALAVDGDRWRAVFTPPASAAPQLAIVAVVSADRRSVDWARIPLVGQGRLTLRSEPDASVVVRVGAIDFGPVRTNAKGRAELVVEAPPGVERAATVATDDLGNVRKGTLALGPPPFARMLVVCPRVGGRTLVLTVDGDTSPTEQPAVALSASLGAVSAPVVEAPGIVAADYSLSADATFGDPLRIAATLGRTDGTARCDTTIPGEMPDGVAVTLDRRELVAGSGATVRVSARLSYPGKLPPIAAPIEATADFGELAFDGAGGQWTVPEDLAGRTAATITVSAADHTAQTGLTLRPGPPVAPRVTASRVTALADGRTRVDIRLALRDAHGNPIRDATVTATARGSVTAFRSDGNGGYTAVYVPPRSFEALVDTVRVTGAGVEGTVAIDLAASRPRFSVSATGGYVTNFGKVSAPAVFADVAFRPPVLEERLSVGVEAGIYASDDERAAAGMGEPVRTRVTAVPVMARATYAVPIRAAAVYGGLSAGALLSEREVSSPGAGRIVHSGPRFAAEFLAGGELRLGPGRAVVEAAFLYARVDDDELDGNAGGLRIGVGYRYDL